MNGEFEVDWGTNGSRRPALMRMDDGALRNAL